MTRVLPDPAPATTRRGRAGWTTGSSCLSFSSRVSASRPNLPLGSRRAANRSSVSTGALYRIDPSMRRGARLAGEPVAGGAGTPPRVPERAVRGGDAGSPPSAQQRLLGRLHRRLRRHQAGAVAVEDDHRLHALHLVGLPGEDLDQVAARPERDVRLEAEPVLVAAAVGQIEDLLGRQLRVAVPDADVD